MLELWLIVSLIPFGFIMAIVPSIWSWLGPLLGVGAGAGAGAGAAAGLFGGAGAGSPTGPYDQLYGADGQPLVQDPRTGLTADRIQQIYEMEPPSWAQNAQTIELTPEEHFNLFGYDPYAGIESMKDMPRYAVTAWGTAPESSPVVPLISKIGLPFWVDQAIRAAGGFTEAGYLTPEMHRQLQFQGPQTLDMSKVPTSQGYIPQDVLNESYGLDLPEGLNVTKVVDPVTRNVTWKTNVFAGGDYFGTTGLPVWVEYVLSNLGFLAGNGLTWAGYQAIKNAGGLANLLAEHPVTFNEYGMPTDLFQEGVYTPEGGPPNFSVDVSATTPGIDLPNTLGTGGPWSWLGIPVAEGFGTPTFQVTGTGLSPVEPVWDPIPTELDFSGAWGVPVDTPNGPIFHAWGIGLKPIEYIWSPIPTELEPPSAAEQPPPGGSGEPPPGGSGKPGEKPPPAEEPPPGDKQPPGDSAKTPKPSGSGKSVGLPSMSMQMGYGAPLPGPFAPIIGKNEIPEQSALEQLFGRRKMQQTPQVNWINLLAQIWGLNK